MNGTIHITIDIDNAAFEDAGGTEVARILRKLATQYEHDGFYVFEKLRDINGNTVGKAELKN